MKKFIFLAFVLSLLILNACTPKPTEPEITVVVSTSAAEVDTYPGPESNSSDDYPAPSTEYQKDPVELTPNPDLAIVKGVILYNGEPVRVILYLSKVIYDDTGNKWVSFNRKSPLRTSTNQYGEFNFYNIPPGEYGLVLDTISSSFLLSVPDGDEIIINISSNETIDLDILDYDDLPIPKP
ncbi:MAG TPA: hypothetical protein EYP88_02625 [Anaerolineales bacterium]|nr:hypothetical protein [Anaerolineales bacterium]